MANTLTDLAPDLYASLDTISRELVGLIPAVRLDASAARGTIGQVVRSYVSPAVSAADVTPGQLAPNSGDQTFTNRTISLSKARRVDIRWNGEEQLEMSTNGIGYRPMLQDQLTQAMRALTNEVEADLAQSYLGASRGYEASGTALFDTDLEDSAQARKILADNGAPLGDLQMVIDTATGVNIRKMTQLTKVNEANDQTLLRQGVLLDIHGFAIRESAQIAEHTAGTASGATTDTAGYAAGATTINLAAAGTGTILAGDIITFTGDANEYVVTSGDADVSNGGSITIAAPGLKEAIAASATDITVKAHEENILAFDRNAIVLATRAPAAPEGGDAADDVMIITDPRSGLSFEVRMYREYRQIKMEVALAWGYSVMNPEHLAILHN